MTGIYCKLSLRTDVKANLIRRHFFNFKPFKSPPPVLNQFLLNLLACPITNKDIYYDSELRAFISEEGKVAFCVGDNNVINLSVKGEHVASIALN
jgi:hypothetical protein